MGVVTEVNQQGAHFSCHPSVVHDAASMVIGQRNSSLLCTTLHCMALALSVLLSG